MGVAAAKFHLQEFLVESDDEIVKSPPRKVAREEDRGEFDDDEMALAMSESLALPPVPDEKTMLAIAIAESKDMVKGGCSSAPPVETRAEHFSRIDANQATSSKPPPATSDVPSLFDHVDGDVFMGADDGGL